MNELGYQNLPFVKNGDYKKEDACEWKNCCFNSFGFYE
jgi:hypothetical protein